MPKFCKYCQVPWKASDGSKLVIPTADSDDYDAYPPRPKSSGTNRWSKRSLARDDSSITWSEIVQGAKRFAELNPEQAKSDLIQKAISSISSAVPPAPPPVPTGGNSYASLLLPAQQATLQAGKALKEAERKVLSCRTSVEKHMELVEKFSSSLETLHGEAKSAAKAYELCRQQEHDLTAPTDPPSVSRPIPVSTYQGPSMEQLSVALKALFLEFLPSDQHQAASDKLTHLLQSPATVKRERAEPISAPLNSEVGLADCEDVLSDEDAGTPAPLPAAKARRTSDPSTITTSTSTTAEVEPTHADAMSVDKHAGGDTEAGPDAPSRDKGTSSSSSPIKSERNTDRASPYPDVSSVPTDGKDSTFHPVTTNADAELAKLRKHQQTLLASATKLCNSTKSLTSPNIFSVLSEDDADEGAAEEKSSP
jgi:hypothetical protein